MTTKTDTYNYTQNPLSGNYTTVSNGGLQSISASGAVATAASVDCATMYALGSYTFLADQSSEVTAGALGNFDWIGALLRSATASSGHGYILYYKPEGTLMAAYTLTAGAIVQGSPLAVFTSVTLATTDKMKFGVVGTTFTAYKNSVSVGTFTDTTYSTGQPGIAYGLGNNGTSRITAWTAIDAGGGSNTGITPTVGSFAVTGNTPLVTPANNSVITPFVARKSGKLIVPKFRDILMPTRRIFLPPLRKAA